MVTTPIMVTSDTIVLTLKNNICLENRGYLPNFKTNTLHATDSEGGSLHPILSSIY